LVVGFVLAGLGGALIQFRVYEAEGFLGFVGKLSPHAHAIEEYSRLFQDSLGAASILPQAGILIGFAFVFFLAAMWLLKFE
jgi:ABC-type multidrug transport system permease subunit